MMKKFYLTLVLFLSGLISGQAEAQVDQLYKIIDSKGVSHGQVSLSVTNMSYCIPLFPTLTEEGMFISSDGRLALKDPCGDDLPPLARVTDEDASGQRIMVFVNSMEGTRELYFLKPTSTLAPVFSPTNPFGHAFDPKYAEDVLPW